MVKDTSGRVSIENRVRSCCPDPQGTVGMMGMVDRVCQETSLIT